MRGIGPDADDVRTMKRRERRAPGNPNVGILGEFEPPHAAATG